MRRRKFNFFVWVALYALAISLPACYYLCEVQTYFGGSDEDTIRDVAIAPDGTLVVVGGTASSDLPGRVNALSSGGFPKIMDGFVAKLTADGTRILWSRYLGGPNYDRSYAVEIDPRGNIYVAGRAGAGFPTTAGAVQPTFGGDTVPLSLYGQQDGFVVKLDAAGTVLWATYVGSDDASIIRDIAVDANENVYLVMPDINKASPHVTASAYQTSHFGTANASGIFVNDDGFVGKLQADGSRFVWGTYFGGSGDDLAAPSVRLHPTCEKVRDQVCSVYVAGDTTSPGLPVSVVAANRVLNNGAGANGNNDILVLKFSHDGSQLQYASYLGGSGNDGTETHNLAVDDLGRIYIGATTRSTDLPGTAGTLHPNYLGSGGSGTGAGTNYPGDGFISVIANDGSLSASTYVGGRFGDGVQGVFVDKLYNVYVSGGTYSDDMAVTPDALQATNGGKADLFVARLSPDLRVLQFATYAGGPDEDYGRSLAADFGGYGTHLVSAGQSLIGTGAPFPTSAGAADTSPGKPGKNEGIIAKFRTQS
jgi:hypothetical protein